MIPTTLILKVHIGENLTKLPIRPAHRTRKGDFRRMIYAEPTAGVSLSTPCV
jgi:hypothetical protein